MPFPDVTQLVATKVGTHLTSADPSGNGYTPTNCPAIHKGHLGGGFRGQNSKVWESCQTAGPIGTNFGSRLRIQLGMDID